MLVLAIRQRKGKTRISWKSIALNGKPAEKQKEEEEIAAQEAAFTSSIEYLFQQDMRTTIISSDYENNWIKRDVNYLIRDMEAVIEQDRPNAVMIYVILLSLAAMGIFNAQTL